MPDAAKKSMNICILGNQPRSTYLFWRVLIRAMLGLGHKVFCLLPDDGDRASIESIRGLGIDVRFYRLDRKGINPLHDARTYFDLLGIFKKTHPDLLFASTIKPVIYGCMAAKQAKVPHIYATITGLGYAFEADSPLKKLINKLSVQLYKHALHGIEGVFFQNKDDAKLFRERGILNAKSRVLYARGTGVDIERFAEAPLPPTENGITFLLVGRLLEAKGCEEYAQAAKIVHARHPEARFQLLGPREQGLGSISDAQLERWQQEGDIEYLGATTDVRPFVSSCHVFVLPSWREGTPTAAMEAMSIGRAAIVTDVPGCREVVEEGENGFLVPVKNPESLARACERFIESPNLVLSMGKCGRSKAVKDFDAQAVAKGILIDMNVPGSAL